MKYICKAANSTILKKQYININVFYDINEAYQKIEGENMKKLLKNCLLIICCIIIFFPKITAGSFDDFRNSFVEITQNYQYCFNLGKMAAREYCTEKQLQDYFSEKGFIIKHEEKTINLKYELLKIKTMMQWANTGLMKRKYI